MILSPERMPGTTGEILTLNIVGAGKVGQTLGAAFRSAGVCRIQSVICRTMASASAAVKFLGEGSPATLPGAALPADLWLIAVPDDALPTISQTLSSADLKDSVVFHCSGALPSTVLGSLAGARIASVHPVRSFVQAGGDLRGTPFALEGDDWALHILTDAVERIGGIPFPIRTEGKLLYHAGLVFLCNYLVSLFEGGFRLLEEGGIARSEAPAVVRPIVIETLENIFRSGPAFALTGPVIRGDAELVKMELDAISDPELKVLYRFLGRVALKLAESQGAFSDGRFEEMRKALI